MGFRVWGDLPFAPASKESDVVDRIEVHRHGLCRKIAWASGFMA